MLWVARNRLQRAAQIVDDNQIRLGKSGDHELVKDRDDSQLNGRQRDREREQLKKMPSSLLLSCGFVLAGPFFCIKFTVPTIRLTRRHTPIVVKFFGLRGVSVFCRKS